MKNKIYKQQIQIQKRKSVLKFKIQRETRTGSVCFQMLQKKQQQLASGKLTYR